MNSRNLFFALLCIAGILSQGCAVGIGVGAAATAATVYDRRTAGTVIDDQLIELKILNALAADEQISTQSHVNATSYNGIVLLTGEAPDEALRAQIASIVEPIDKVRQVHNELIIAAPSSALSRSSDTWLTGKVKTALLGAEDVDAGRIKVVTEAGTVYLMGLVTRDEAEHATDVARRTGGVQRVVKLFEYMP